MNSNLKCCKQCGSVEFKKNNRCKPCSYAITAKWRIKNAEKIQQYRVDNSVKLKAQEAAWRSANLEKTQTGRDERKKTCPEVAKEASARHYRKNAAKMKSNAALFYLNNKEHCLNRQKAWVKNNPEKVKLIQLSQRCKDKLNPLNKLKNNVSSRIRTSLLKGGYTKTSRTHEILGCDWVFFKCHIERQFLKGMSWQNMGCNIHIDHIVPLATAKTEEDVLALNHFTNLRPLWAIDNLKKNARITHLI